jgi:hypothetical protein
MNWKDAAQTLAKIGLPLLGAALPLPGGMALGASLAAHIGAKETTVDGVVNALIGNEEARQKAVEFQAMHNERMTNMVMKHELDMYQSANQDRASARSGNVASGMNEKLFWLTCVLLIITLGCEAAVLFMGIPSGANEFVIGRVLGLLDSITLSLLAYWFGSSLGSSMKNDWKPTKV